MTILFRIEIGETIHYEVHKESSLERKQPRDGIFYAPDEHFIYIHP